MLAHNDSPSATYRLCHEVDSNQFFPKGMRGLVTSGTPATQVRRMFDFEVIDLVFSLMHIPKFTSMEITDREVIVLFGGNYGTDDAARLTRLVASFVLKITLEKPRAPVLS